LQLLWGDGQYGRRQGGILPVRQYQTGAFRRGREPGRSDLAVMEKTGGLL